MRIPTLSFDLLKRRDMWAMTLLTLSVMAAGCTPAMGDPCQTNLECGAQSGAICDVSVPQGYCTVAQCVPNGCPDESVCVRFDEQNSYCMQVCLDDSECREEHVCRDVGTYGDQGYGYCYVSPQL